MQFPIVLHTDDGIHYGVTVPDVPGCFSGGNGIDDALASAREAIDLHLEGVLDDGGEIPLPGTISGHQRNPDFAGGIWALVEVDTSRFDGKTQFPPRSMAAVRIARASSAVPQPSSRTHLPFSKSL